jgi:hypothetical protein
MNAEVEVHVGAKYGAVAVPNAALRTDGDVPSAAELLGFDPDEVMRHIAEQRAGSDTGNAAAGATTPGADSRTITLMGRSVTVPENVSMEDARAIEAALRGASDRRAAMESLSEAQRNAMRQLMGGMRGGGFGGGDGERYQGGGTSSTDAALLGGSYTVFAMKGGFAEPLAVRTGITDLDYSEVLSGLKLGDTVLVLPSSSLLASQQQMQDRLSRMRGGLPGISRH